MICFGIDIDGTVECAGGPVRLSTLYELQALGHIVIIVSPSPTCSPPNIERYAPFLLPRFHVLKNVKASIRADRYIYVGDRSTDQDAAAIADWEFVDALSFEEWLKS